MRSLMRIASLLACTVLVPMDAYAQVQQASITGVVRDTSGGVLPGVTVEVASPVLIEKVRSAVTDGTGQYRVADLRPGTYTVTFMLTGFSTVRRDGIELIGSITASVDAELRVGALEETIVVTGESPLVDVQSARREQTLDRELISAIPTARGISGVAVLVPGMTGSTDLGGLGSTGHGAFGMHGRGDGRIFLDGLAVGSSFNGNVSSYIPDVGAAAAEVVITTSGGLGEAESGGVMMNIVPRVGGNTTSGTFFATGANSAMQGDNLTQELKDRGLRATNDLKKVWDINSGVGGAFRKDRLWYFLAGRYVGNREYIAGMYHNKNAGDPSKWTYEPDLTRRAFRDLTRKNLGLRLTWQITSRNKLNLYLDEQAYCSDCVGGGSPTHAPEARSPSLNTHPSRVHQATWTAPVTSRLLLEAGYSAFASRWPNDVNNSDIAGYEERRGNSRDLIPVTEQAGIIPGLAYRGQDWTNNFGYSPRWLASASYVTATHNMKIGYMGHDFWFNISQFTNDHRLHYRFNNGVPNQLTMFIVPRHFVIPGAGGKTRTKSHAVYAQDQWTLGRLTLQGAVRYDYAASRFPEQQVGPDRFLPNRIVFPAQAGVSGYHDIVPRLGVAYDLLGNRKTAVKVNLGKYVVNAANSGRYTATNPINRFAGSTTRSWNDANGDFVADCDLLNPAENGECGAWGNQNFGRISQITTYDSALFGGWDVRLADWSFGVGVQQQLLPRVSLAIDYNRRQFVNKEVTDNVLVGPSDYDRYSITAPVDPRLPGGGGDTISDLYDINPAKFGQVRSFVTSASNFGKPIEHWHGVDVSVAVRLGARATAQGGFSTGRRVTDNCDVTPKLENPSRRFCRVTEAFLTQVKALATYTIPKVDVQISGTFQSRPGAELAANWFVPTQVVAQSLGRSLAGGERNVAVNLIEPGTLYGDRTNQLDFRVAKVLKFGRARTQIGLDVYNALNSTAVQTYNLTYGPRWLTPLTVLPARFAQISAHIDF